jgi:RNA polymerase sigma factor, sigma-70 family
MKSYAANSPLLSDNDYIYGLKNLDNRVTHQFFYKECCFLLNDIRYSLYNGRIGYDELVNELYLELSAGNWKRLNSFSGVNDCHLKTWLSVVSWHFFYKKKMALMEKDSEEELMSICKDTYDIELNIEIAMDVKRVMSLMKNERYVDILRLMIIEGYSPEEVARKWNKAVDNIYNIKHRAIKEFLSIYNSNMKTYTRLKMN